MEKKEIKKIKKSSKRSAIISLMGVFIVLISLAYSYYQISSLEKVLFKKQQQINIKKIELNNLDKEVKTYKNQVRKLESEIYELKSTQESLLDFLASVTDKEMISILDPSVDWKKIKDEIIKLPAGKRKDAILTAILLAWKEIPFAMGKESISGGFDSPRFLRYVLSKVGVIIETISGQRLSDTLMNAFEKTDNPMPGDLAFYKGQVGSFGFILTSIGDEETAPTGIGTLQKIAPLQIISLDNINIPYFPLIGYFRVKYPDE